MSLLYSIVKTSDKKRYAHDYNSSKLRHETRKHGVIDGRVTKKPGLGYSSHRKSPEPRPQEQRMPNQSYTYQANPQLYNAPAAASAPEGQRETANASLSTSVAGQAQERYNELSPLMTTMVEDELKDIMINIWQTLPNEGASEAESIVLEHFKGAAGDDLRNAIGLNVTKRLLNVHNGILVQVIIYSSATPAELDNFAIKYNITDLRNIQRWRYTGRLRSWTDLDELVANRNLRCGKSRVTVLPAYNFLKCPSSLRTKFDGGQNYSDVKKKEYEIARKIKKLKRKAISIADKLLDKEPESKTVKEQVPDDKSSKEPVSAGTSSKDKISVNKSSNDGSGTKKIENSDKGNTEPPKKRTKEVTKNLPSTKNTTEKLVDKSINKQTKSTAIDRELPMSKPNEVKTETKITKVDTAKVVTNKPPNANNAKKDSGTPAFKGDSPKTVLNKTSLNNAPKVATNTPKMANNNPNVAAITPENAATNTKVAKTPNAVTNTPIKATNTPKPTNNAPKTTTNTPTATANVSKVGTNAPKGATTNSPKVAIAPKKDIVANTSNENNTDVKTTKVEPLKTPVKATAKPVATKTIPNKPVANQPTPNKPVSKQPIANKTVANKPTTPNSATKETISQKPNIVKKTEINAAKVDLPKESTMVNKQVTNTPKKLTKTIEKKTPGTKFTKKVHNMSNKLIKTAAKTSKNRVENDFDELSDHDILALLSSGIVLDECSGSD